MAISNQTICRRCGRPIRWIDTPAGKKMPVDAASRNVRELPGAREVFVLASGKVIHGEQNDSPESVRGWTSHFATCKGAR